MKLTYQEEGSIVAYSVKMSEFREMSEEQRSAAVSRLVQGALTRPNGLAERIEMEIGAFERKYEITSERLLEELYEGTRSETADIARWLWLLDLRKRTSHYQTG
jgi:hypothetical protein